MNTRHKATIATLGLLSFIALIFAVLIFIPNIFLYTLVVSCYLTAFAVIGFVIFVVVEAIYKKFADFFEKKKSNSNE